MMFRMRRRGRKIMSNQRRTASLNGESLDVIHVRVLVKSEPVDLYIGVRSRGGNSALGSETIFAFLRKYY